LEKVECRKLETFPTHRPLQYNFPEIQESHVTPRLSQISLGNIIPSSGEYRIWLWREI